MPKEHKEWSFNYLDLARITGQDEQTIRQHRSRRRFDPGKLESVVVYLSRYGVPELKTAIVEYALAKDGVQEQPLKIKRPRKAAE